MFISQETYSFTVFNIYNNIIRITGSQPDIRSLIVVGLAPALVYILGHYL